MLTVDDIILRNNVRMTGSGDTTLVLAHGFGCDQNMWRFVEGDLAKDHRVVLFDYCGSGQSDVSFYDRDRYASLDGYAEDVVEIHDALGLQDTVLIGHSVSSMIGLLASISRPELISKLVMVCPSPCFLNDPPAYHGGFERADLEELISLMDKNYIGWAGYLAPLVMGQTNPDDLVQELNDSFCSTDPVLAKNFAMATFFADNRQDLSRTKAPALVLQSARDSLAAPEIGAFIQKSMLDSVLRIVEADGHCLHMTHPRDVVREVTAFVSAA